MGLRDMYSAISGLEANSTWLDVIGNNISNTNTTAYKASAVSFSDSYSQTLSSGSGDNVADELGGVDPEQVGLGTRVQAITANWTEGSIQQTGVATDVAINGTGFLISKQGADTYLTRAGNLAFDGAGNLVDANGGLIQGYTASLKQTETTIDTAADAGTANPLVITQTAYKLNDLDTSAIGNININPNMTMPAAATTEVNFVGNLDAAQQVNGATGGVEQMFTGAAAGDDPVLPLGLAGIALNPAVFSAANSLQGPVAGPPAVPAGVLVQTAEASTGAPLITGAVDLGAVVAGDAGTYAWEQQPPVTPALTSQETVYDSNGNPETITVQFYQVNDIGGAGINAAGGPSQTAYAWYAFNTTGGAAVSTANLVGGTGIIEGDVAGGAQDGYDRGVAGTTYAGDLITFNTDGSLATTGGVNLTTGTQSTPDIYLPPINPASANQAATASPIPSIGAEITQVALNFGTAGVIGTGERNGLTGDADGTYQTINGVNTYVPDSYATVTQNGYSAGTLTGIAFDQTGKINGTFTNGQTIALAQVAMASVENEGGLNSVGNNYYTTSTNSGAETIGLAGSNGMGTITGGALEGSNVDLTVELTNMIIAQRGFETNARVISVESQDMQTLTQLGQ